MEKDKNKTIEFLNYIKNPLSESSIAILYDANSIRFDKCQLYSDFVCSLLMIVFDTYLSDVITTEKQQLEHFNWCWNKNISNFKEEDIIFTPIKELHDYFKEFTFEVYYAIEDKDNSEYVNTNLISLWEYIFDYKKPKSRSDIDSFIEIYNIFEKSVKK
jgi:hypothetical protein